MRGFRVLSFRNIFWIGLVTFKGKKKKMLHVSFDKLYQNYSQLSFQAHSDFKIKCNNASFYQLTVIKWKTWENPLAYWEVLKKNQANVSVKMIRCSFNYYLFTMLSFCFLWRFHIDKSHVQLSRNIIMFWNLCTGIFCCLSSKCFITKGSSSVIKMLVWNFLGQTWIHSDLITFCLLLMGN